MAGKQQNSLVAFAIQEAFQLLKSELPELQDGAEQLTAEGLEKYMSDRVDNVVANDKRDGWSNTHVADPKNDYNGGPIEKRIDNMIFLYGKALPGKATDKLRDYSSGQVTPIVFERFNKAGNTDPTGEDIALGVKEVVVELAKAGLESLPHV